MLDLSVSSETQTRRRRTAAEKVQIVKESLAPNISIASVALAHRINANQLHNWRWQYRNGKLGKPENLSVLLPVRLTKSGSEAPHAITEKHSPVEPGYVEILIGQDRVWVYGTVEANTLRSVVMALRS